MAADPRFHSLHDATWAQRAGLRSLTDALGADNIRWVGGAIRDSLLGHPVEDVDCATTHLPAAVIDKCNAAGIRTVPTGIDHGTITAVLDDGPVEITTLRRDVATDGRRATIAFAQDWQEDAARRDFTINALFAHPETLEVTDYFGGLDDLEERRVRFIGDARQRIREDHLRIMRYFRFQARFGYMLDEDAESACAELAETIKGLSRERVAMELLKLLQLPDPAPTVARMRKLGVLQVILPETCPPQLANLEQLIAAEQEQSFAPSAIRRLAALLPVISEVADAVAARLRLSRKQRAHLICVAERNNDDPQHAAALAYREGTDCAIDRILLTNGDASALKDWQVPQFPLKGGLIVERGIAAGPDIARILRAIEDRWIAEGFPDEERVMALLEEALS
ncbi:MAG: CCA tRNA nucleotidyltransferase [Erythrobacter sp.]